MAKYVKLEIEVTDAELEALKRCVSMNYVETAIQWSIAQYVSSEHGMYRMPASEFDKPALRAVLEWQRDMLMGAILQAERRFKREG